MESHESVDGAEIDHAAFSAMESSPIEFRFMDSVSSLIDLDFRCGWIQFEHAIVRAEPQCAII